MIGYDKERKTYFVKHNYKDPLTGKWKAKFKRGFKLKREAAEYETKLKSDDINPDKSTGAGALISSRTTFAEVAALWEDTIESSPVSRRHHREHFTRRFADYYDKPIKSITKPQLVLWRNELAKKDYATKTKNTCLGYVRSVFKFASDLYGIPNISIVLKNFKETQEEKMSEMNVWTVEEFNQFISAVDARLYKIFFTTLFWTGCRRGEAIALQCSDLDEKNQSIYIHASQRNTTTGLQPTKTGTNRTVKLDDILFQELLELKKNYKKGYLFGGDQPMTPTNIDRYFAKGIKKSGVKKIRLHDLRHSHATILINSGVNIVAVSKRLGHTSIEQTLKTYTHLLKETDERMMNTIQSLHKV